MKVTGIGGIVFLAKDPDSRSAWYREHLGIERLTWEQEAGQTVFAPTETGTTMFGNGSQQFLVNFRVDALPALQTEVAAMLRRR
jgi:hypothetical protein